MTTTVVEQVEEWFTENCKWLSEVFPVLRFHLMQAKDPVRGKVAIGVDGPVVVASITFWNKGEVDASVLEKTKQKEQSLDDRKLTVNDDVKTLLHSYFKNIQA